jgi:hypothetical protein
MDHGELLTRLTVWMAVINYAIAVAITLRANGNIRALAVARWPWTLGCAFFLAHVVCAFSFYHHWSHLAATAATARQTEEVVGLHWGGGLYFNYLFALMWCADVVWSWLAFSKFRQRPVWMSRVVHAFLFFIVLNGTVVFANGAGRWLGVILCSSVILLWVTQPGRSSRSG